MKKHDSNIYDPCEIEQSTGIFQSWRGYVMIAVLAVALIAVGMDCWWQSWMQKQTVQSSPVQAPTMPQIEHDQTVQSNSVQVPMMPQTKRKPVSISYRLITGPLMCDDYVFDVDEGEEINVTALDFDGFVCVSPDFTTVAQYGLDYGYTFFYVREEDVDEFINGDVWVLLNPLSNRDMTVLGLTPQ